MKIKFNPNDNNFEIETQTMPSWCSLCGLFIGSVEIIKGSEYLHWMLQCPLCSKCFSDKFGGFDKVTSPKVAGVKITK